MRASLSWLLLEGRCPSQGGVFRGAGFRSTTGRRWWYESTQDSLSFHERGAAQMQTIVRWHCNGSGVKLGRRGTCSKIRRARARECLRASAPRSSESKGDGAGETGTRCGTGSHIRLYDRTRSPQSHHSDSAEVGRGARRAAVRNRSAHGRTSSESAAVRAGRHVATKSPNVTSGVVPWQKEG